VKHVVANFKELFYLLLCVDDHNVLNFQPNHDAKCTGLLDLTFCPSKPRDWVLRQVYGFRPARDKLVMVHMLITVVDLCVFTPSDICRWLSIFVLSCFAIQPPVSPSKVYQSLCPRFGTKNSLLRNFARLSTKFYKRGIISAKSGLNFILYS